ncbi:D-alanyl-D-alanine carboxypeptidase [Streptomyces sp. NBC_00704]|uniref:D-alanyl-D-alanine carboxypeptidase n=1 Tax=Streptomyces sp. NBC_00704 TaxID=2975809 RepID=UPI002E2EB99A|nr:D-alanyl-D-alanine carboxypeptidase [Streptomyces sp. NBC_00704]
MAGESPDRSKQRESSAEPTSGSAGTVPEARESGDSREPRDPRVAVARDGGPSAARGGVDTATRVFSVRGVKTEPEESEQSEGSEQSEEPEERGEPAGSGRTDESEKPEAAAEPEAAEATSADGTPATGKAAEPEAADDAEAAADAESAPEEPQPRETAQDASTGAPKAEDGESAPEISDTAAAGGDERLRAAVAQWVSTADEKTAGKSTPDPDADQDPHPDSDSDSGSGSEERSASAGEATDRPASKSASKPAPKWATDDKADKEDKADETGKAAEPDEEAGRSVETGDETGGKAADRPVDQPTAVFKTPRPKPAVDQPTTMLKLGAAARPTSDEDAKSAEDAKSVKGAASVEDAKDDAAARTGGAGKPGTADKADKAGKPAAARTAGTADEADDVDAGSADEPVAERTSTFVALKPLDEPRAPKPPVKPSAPRQADVTALVPQVGPERTTQQPLPPKPPLDLLAELTNTPPPPPTPLRQLRRRLKIWTPLVLLLLVVFAIAQAARPLPTPGLTLTAKDSYTFEGGKTQLPWPNEGQGWMDADGVGTMGSFGKQTPVAIGSVAKTMTSYIILKSHPMKAGEEGPRIRIDATAEKEGGYDVTGDESTLNTVKEGQTLTEHQALSAVLIPSANNIARLLARWDAGSEAAFVKKMNATARELGMTNTTYTDPSGLKETTVSTAEDQVKLGRAFVKVPALVAISSAASWDDPSGKNWPNYNTLPYNMGAIGIKTGSTTAAGGNLLFASRKKVGGQTVTLVGAVLGQHKPRILETVNAVSQKALLAAQDALASAKILKKGDVVGYVDDRLGNHTPVVITEDVPAVGWAGMTVKLSFTAGEVPHSAKAGAQVGTLTVGDGTSGAVKVPVALRSDLNEPGFPDKLTRLG